MALAAGIMAGGAIIGGLLQSNSAQDTAQTQANAATQVAGMSQAQWNQVRQSLQPYMTAGNAGLNALVGAMPQLTQGFAPTMA